MNINARISAAGQESPLETIMKRFHKDFVAQTDAMLGLMEEDKAYRIEEKKKTKLRAIVSPSSTTTNVVNRQTFVGANGNSSGGNSVISKIVKHIISIDNTLKENGLREEKRGHTNFRLQSIQARFLSNAIEKWTGIAFKGPSEQERLLNAVENVEHAVRQQESTTLDERSGIENLLQSPFFKKNFTQLSKLGDFIEVFDMKKMSTEILSGKFGGLKDRMMGVSGKVQTLDVKGAIEKIKETIFANLAKSDIEVSPETKKSINNIVGGVLGSITNVMSNFNIADAWRWIKRKSITGIATLWFGGIQNYILTQMAFHPIKTLRGANLGMRAMQKTYGAYKLVGQKFSEYVTDPLRKVFGIEKKVLGKSRFIGGTAIKAMSGFLNAWAETGTMEASKKIGAIAGPFWGMLFAPFHAIFIKKRDFFAKDMKKAGLGMAKGFTSMIVGFARVAGLAIANLPVLIGVAIVGAILGIAYAVYTYWDDIKKAFSDYILDPIAETFNSVVDSIKNIFTGLSDSVESALRSTKLGSKAADLLFGENGGATEVSGATSQVIDGTPMMTSNGKIDKAMIAKTQGIDMSELVAVMGGMKDSLIKQQSQPQIISTPPPVANIDDLGTLLITQ